MKSNSGILTAAGMASQCLTSARPSRAVGTGAVGANTFTSWSNPLVARTGIWGCGSKQFTWGGGGGGGES